LKIHPMPRKVQERRAGRETTKGARDKQAPGKRRRRGSSKSSPEDGTLSTEQGEFRQGILHPKKTLGRWRAGERMGGGGSRLSQLPERSHGQKSVGGKMAKKNEEGGKVDVYLFCRNKRESWRRVTGK